MPMPLPADFVDELSALLGDGWRVDAATCEAHASDDSRRQQLPEAVALPTTREQVQAIVRACRAYRIPIVAQGAGTATTGAAVPVSGGIALSFSRMNRILDIRPEDRCAVVEPGMHNGDLQVALQAHNLF